MVDCIKIEERASSSKKRKSFLFIALLQGNIEDEVVFSFMKEGLDLKLRVVTKICDRAKYHNRHRSQSIRVTKLCFCQNDPPRSISFWQNNSLVTQIFFDLCLL